MEYLAFALKYRPQNFDEVVGQEHVVVALKNAILKNRVHHAYLFSGPRGVGKTSLARILAKSLNCADGPTVNPCGKCTSCIEITKGTSLDIIEIDGASNRGIDEIRALRENVKLCPAYARYKIYIIDEVHMLTQEAFNALLKTLEEPPAHVKFIFATTHPQKVLPTILSRCQKFQFSLLPLEKIVEKLKKITSLENLKIEDNIIYAIARAAGGSIRDAESLLDTLVPVILEKGTIEDVFSFLGIIDEETLNTALKYIVERNLNDALYFLDKLSKEGKDLGVFLNALIEYLRNLLLAKVSVSSFNELINLSPQSKEKVFNLSHLISTQDVLKIIDLLIEAKDLSNRLNSVRIPLELALIKFFYKEEKKEIESAHKNNNSSLRKEKIKVKKEEKMEEMLDFEDMEIEEIDLEEDDDASNPTDESSSDCKVFFEELKDNWERIISEIKKVRAAIASHLSFARLYSLEGNVATIAFSKENKFHKEIVEANKNLKFIQEMISKYMGNKIAVKFTLIDNMQDQNREPKEKKLKREEEINEKAEDTTSSTDEFINELLDIFEGRLHTQDE
jgi:DNA polymerase-3 subunit gamma/tau